MVRTILLLSLCLTAVGGVNAEEGLPVASRTPLPSPTPLPTPSPTPSNQAWRAVERVLGKEGEVREGRLHLSFPRYDLNLMIEGVALEPQMVESLLTFTAGSDSTKVEGSLMVLDREASRALEGLWGGGFEVLGLESPFWNASPPMKLLRFRGSGSKERLAENLKKALKRTGVLKPSPAPGATPSFKPVSPIVEETFGPGHKEGSTLRYSWGGPGPAFPECTLRFQGEGDRFAVSVDWALGPEDPSRLLQSFTEAGLRPAALWREGPGGAQFRGWYSGPPKDVLKVLSKEWGKLVPAATPGQ